MDELRFAVLSAARFHTGDAGWAIRVYTDRPDLFAGLPAEMRAVSPETAAAWSGSAGYVYRGKIAALADALADPDTTRAVIVDGDTYVTRSPEKLLSRIAPGRTVMHQREGRPHPPEMAALRTVLAVHTPVDAAGRSWGITETETLWNSGVVGLHRSDAGLCDEALSLTDQLIEHGFAERSHTAEMVAFGVVLDRRSTIKECRDVVTHYWPAKIRKPFLVTLREVWADRSIDQQTAFERLWAARPRESLEDRLKTRVKRTAATVGLELGRRS